MVDLIFKIFTLILFIGCLVWFVRELKDDLEKGEKKWGPPLPIERMHDIPPIYKVVFIAALIVMICTLVYQIFNP